MTEQTAFPVKETGIELGSMAGAVVWCLGLMELGYLGLTLGFGPWAAYPRAVVA